MTKEEQQPLVGDVCANCKFGRYILDPTEPGYWWCDNPWIDGRVDCDHTCPRWKPWRMKRKKRAESEKGRTVMSTSELKAKLGEFSSC